MPNHLPWMSSIISAVVFGTVAAAPTFGASCRSHAPEQRDLLAYRATFGTLVNAERRRLRLPALQSSPELERVAAAYACSLADNDHFDHIGPDGSTLSDRASASTYKWCLIAENLALGQRRVKDVFAAWLRSDSHRTNMLLKDARQYGLSVLWPGNADAAAGGALTERLSRFGARAGPARALPEPSSELLPERSYWVLLLGRRC